MYFYFFYFFCDNEEIKGFKFIGWVGDLNSPIAQQVSDKKIPLSPSLPLSLSLSLPLSLPHTPILKSIFFFNFTTVWNISIF